MVGDILGRFYNKEGFIDDINADEQLITRPMQDVEEALRRHPIRITEEDETDRVFCGGTGKLEGIITAAKLQLFYCLITDALTATELAASLEQ